MRTDPFRDEHIRSTDRARDRVRHRPHSLRAYLAWAKREYTLELPLTLHHLSVTDEGGNPAMTGEAKAFLGFAQSKPQDWLAVASRQDDDGYYVTPFCAALASLRRKHPVAGAFIHAVVANELDPASVAGTRFGLPDDVAWFVLRGALPDLYARWTPRKRRTNAPTWVDKSDSQRAAEDAA